MCGWTGCSFPADILQERRLPSAPGVCLQGSVTTGELLTEEERHGSASDAQRPLRRASAQMAARAAVTFCQPSGFSMAGVYSPSSASARGSGCSS